MMSVFQNTKKMKEEVNCFWSNCFLEAFKQKILHPFTAKIVLIKTKNGVIMFTGLETAKNTILLI